MGIVAAVVQFVFAIAEVLLLLRLLFVFFHAASVGFAGLIFSWTDPLLAPFAGVFPNLAPVLLILVVMVIYAIISAVLIWIFRALD